MWVSRNYGHKNFGKVFASFFEPFVSCWDASSFHAPNTSKLVMKDNNVNWWRSYYFVWCHQEYIRREIKPHKEQLIDGILKFWETVDVIKCRRYIGHLEKVVPMMIEGPTGYWTDYESSIIVRLSFLSHT